MASYVGFNIVDSKSKKFFGESINLANHIRKFCKDVKKKSKSEEKQLGDIYAMEVLLYSIPMTPYDFERDTELYHKMKRDNNLYDLATRNKNYRKSTAAYLGNLHILNLNKSLGRKLSEKTRLTNYIDKHSGHDNKRTLLRDNIRSRLLSDKKSYVYVNSRGKKIKRLYGGLSESKRQSKYILEQIKERAIKDTAKQTKEHMIDTADVYRKGRAWGITYSATGHDGFDYPAYLYSAKGHLFQQDEGNKRETPNYGRGYAWLQRAYNKYGDKIEDKIAGLYIDKKVNNFNKSIKASSSTVSELNDEDFGLNDPNLKRGKIENDMSEVADTNNVHITNVYSSWSRNIFNRINNFKK